MTPGTLLEVPINVSGNEPESDYGDNELFYSEWVNPNGATLRVDKHNYDWWGDQTINFELRVLNLGTQTLLNFWITDTYPLSTTFNGNWNVNHGGWYTLTVDAANRQLIFWGERLDPGATASLSVRFDLDGAVVGQPGLTFTNQVAAPIAGDVFPADNLDQATAFTGPDLYVKKELQAGSLLPGELITYTIERNSRTLRFGLPQQRGSTLARCDH